MLIPYTKPHLPIPDQIALLQSRGMAITDHAKAADHLQRHGYYRLSGYWFPARMLQPVMLPDGAIALRPTDAFRAGTTLENIVNLCVFDKKLRMLLLDALERIEVSLRVEAALFLSAKSPIAHRETQHLSAAFTRSNPPNGTSRHNEWLNRIDQLAAKSREEFVASFDAKYLPPLPLWITIELWDFGTLSHFLSGMRMADLNVLARRYNLPHGSVLTSFARNLNIARNICAHHSRLWNRVNSGTPHLPQRGNVPYLDHLHDLDPSQLSRLYGTAAICQHFMSIVCPSSSWSQRLITHLDTFPAGPGIEFRHTGFPANWKTLDLWR